MNKIRAIYIGIVLWIIKMSVYSISTYISILDNTEQQANMLLFISIIPLVWIGAKLYYIKDTDTHGYWVGQTFFLAATVLDAIITVPFFIIPNGGSFYQFFTNIGFWLIGFEVMTLTLLYWYINVEMQKSK